MECTHLFKDKRITVMGLGLLGRGVGDVEFLAKCGAEVLVTDKKSEAELAESVEKLKKYSNITFRLGGHRKEDFENCDLVIKAAGVPLDSSEIAAARAAGVEVAMSTALFAKYAADIGVTIVGVTGTRGKTTVTRLIYHVLRRTSALRQGSGRERQVFLGGNIRGLSTLAMLPEVKKGDIAVLELDSWQLQGFDDLKISPHVSVFTNLMPDHLNYYADMENYFADKANIFRYQKEGDALFVGRSILQQVITARPPVAPQVPPTLPSDWKLKIIGEHNLENAALAAAALHALGLSESEVRAGIESFEPVEGRLQFLREIDGVKIYNDNNATTPEATMAALRSLEGGITLIVGGSEKGLPLEGLVAEMQKKVAHVVLLTHPNYKGSERLAATLKKENVPFEEADNLDAALEAALSHTQKGAILFSPAFASFGMFKNEYDRNDKFMRLVREMGDAA